MQVSFNRSGVKRKELVQAIARITGEKAVYMKVPTCNYKVGDYTITKEGTVISEDSMSLQRLVHRLIEDGFKPVDGYKAVMNRENNENEMDTTETEDAEAKTPEVENDEHIEDTESGDNKNDERTEDAESSDTKEVKPDDKLDEAETESEAQTDNLDLTVEIPLDKVAVGNVTKLLDAKGNLIKLALGIDSLPIEIKEDRVAFPWFTEVEPEEAMAYTKFISALCKMAKEAKRVTAVEKEIVNPKYEFRCFLLRLGFIGDDYKADRKVLLKNLSGSSAWKSGQKGGSNDELSE